MTNDDTTSTVPSTLSAVTDRIMQQLHETSHAAFQRGFREGWTLEEFPVWLDEEIEVCHTQLHGETDPEERAKLTGMIRAYENTAHYLEMRGISVRGTSR